MSVPPIQSGYPVAGTVVDDEIGDPLSKKAEIKEFSEDSGPEDGYEGYGENPFKDEAVAEHWRQVYHDSQYECRHVFDPTLTWSEEEEKAIIRRLDWRVCLWACCMFFGLQVDRGNLVQAVSDNMLDDLGLDTNVFLISFLFAELPSQLISKKVGPDSFLIEGLITLTVGIASFFLMPASAVQTKTWFRPNGWFSDREVAIVVNRVLRDDPSKGDMHNRQALTPRRLWQTMKDYDLWPLYLLGLIIFIPQSPPSKYLTLIVKSLGFSTFNTNLLTIPSSIFHILTLLAITRLSDYLNEKTLVAMLQSVWTLPCVIALEWWPGMIDEKWGTFALVTVLLSYPYCHAILVAWTSKNSNNVGTRSVSAALYNMSVQLGNIIANFIYRDDDKPYYRRGNRNLFIINLLAIVLFLFTKAYYIWRNKQKDRIWNALSKEEQEHYIKNTRLQGSRRLDFRFSH
ncbi:putative allantoate permease [Diaporthe ampelina]|uniref:Putative allantoate permease n=1 Tax=Diaporthe ampelina TaxID=1214573 RepID=A0A0G2HTE2_9PEZI|nr:putative allantoate permease [Diaporthe ampelina]